MALVRGVGRRRPDRGVTTVEYALLLVGVAGLVVALFVASPGVFKQLYDQVFCHLGPDACAGGGGGGPSIDPWDSPDPVTRATWGTMVVLGDSYSSGEGGDDYGVTGSTPSCHASANGYGPTVAKSLHMSDRLKVAACTGATLHDLTKPYRDHDQPPQIGAVDDTTSLITMSLGGNDLDWSAVLMACGAHHAYGLLATPTPALGVPGLPLPAAPTCSSALNEGVQKRIAKVAGQLDDVYATLRTRAPHARIVVVGYPHPFPTRPTDAVTYSGAVVADPADQMWMNGKLDEFNAKLATAAMASGVEFVDTSHALAGHELTTADPWIFGLDRQNWHSVGPAQHDFHPTPEGQAAMAKLVQQQVRHP